MPHHHSFFITLKACSTKEHEREESRSRSLFIDMMCHLTIREILLDFYWGLLYF